jgi:hypothetical protein
MDQADDELRDTIRNIWPLQAKKMLDLLIPRNEGTRMFVHVSVLCIQARLLSFSSIIIQNENYKTVCHLPTQAGLYMNVIKQRVLD